MRRSRFWIILVFSALLLSTAFTINTEPVAAANPTLSYGAQGPEVIALQDSLNRHGCICAVDGIFGQNTMAAVKLFQRSARLEVDGIVGPRTREALGVNSTPDVSAATASVSRGGNRSTKIVTMIATGYCPCNKCNYPYGGQPTYLGDPVRHGVAAVDPNVIGMGSQLLVEGYGYAKASDQGNAIKGNRIDLCFNTHGEALQWGIRTVKVTVLY